MARVGEGDPRWIVAERQDGQNVNSWHWEERDLSASTHEDLKNKFAGMSFTSEAGLNLKADEVSDISGDVTVAQRKGKMMCYFELKFTVKWSGTVDGEDNKVSGRCVVPEVDHDTFESEYTVDVSTTDNDANSQKAEKWMRADGRKAVRSVVQKYFEDIFEKYQIGKTIKQGSMPPPPPAPVSTQAASNTSSTTTTTTTSAPSKPSSSGSSSFSWKMRWRVPIDELFLALTNEQRASAYTRSVAKIDPRAGGAFEFLGGFIAGYYVDVQAPTLLKMQWRLNSWATGIHSSVVMQLVKEEPGVTVLEFAQSGIPEGQLDSVRDGWNANFFSAIKALFGYTMDFI